MTAINLQTLAGGAVAERFNNELQTVLDNIADPNTEPTKKRKMTLTVTFTPNEDRDVASVSFLIKKNLVPAKEIGTSFVIGHDGNGQVAAKELKSGIPGQMFIDDDGDVATDTGEKVLKLETTKSKKAGGSK